MLHWSSTNQKAVFSLFSSFKSNFLFKPWQSYLNFIKYTLPLPIFYTNILKNLTRFSVFLKKAIFCFTTSTNQCWNLINFPCHSEVISTTSAIIIIDLSEKSTFWRQFQFDFSSKYLISPMYYLIDVIFHHQVFIPCTFPLFKRNKAISHTPSVILNQTWSSPPFSF